MVTNADTDGDLRAVRAGRSDAPGTPAGPGSPGDASPADFAGFTSRELGQTARRLIAALAHRTDSSADAELRHVSEALQQALADPSRAVAGDGYPPAAERTDPGRDPVWERWFR